MAIGLALFREWRRRAKPVAEPARTIPRWDKAGPQVPAQYLSLYAYLEHRYASTVVLTFEQIEALLGFALPLPASTEPDWWTGVAVPRAHSSSWIRAGRTASPNFLARTVTFERQA
jgi:hypothetical protein